MSYSPSEPDSTNGVDNDAFHSSDEDNISSSSDVVVVNRPKPSVNSKAKQGRQTHAKSVSIDIDLSPKTSMSNIHFSRAAVAVHNAYKSYGGTGSAPVLKNLNMTVKQGTIYSLLGASGCGKTTLLSCVVGLRKLNLGDIYVFGTKAGSKASGVPGKRVGYMPQEIALFGEFSICESLRYYGRMYSMTSSQIEENITFLIDFLNLPPATRRVNTLSGGQQRRVSFACSMVHNPELLLLDEPTVGVDALLRKSIWEHLVKLVSSGKTTVIITTHYIEEARLSNTIGVMRNGKLLVEDSPSNLLKRYETNLLEDIVMQLCLKDAKCGDDDDTDPDTNVGSMSLSKIKKSKSPDSYRQNRNFDEPRPSDPNLEEVVKWRKLHRASVVAELRQKPERVEQIEDSWNRFVTLLIKNYMTLLRNITFLTFILFCPALQVIIVCLAIGGDPKGLHFGVVNHELLGSGFNSSLGSNCDLNLGSGCPLHDNFTGMLSCHFMEMIDKDYLQMKMYDNEDTAIRDVKHSSIWGVVTFAPNYSQSFKERALFGANTEIESVYGSRIGIQMDFSNKQIGAQIGKNFHTTFDRMMKNISSECGIEPIKSELPLFYDTPVYGDDKLDFREYIAPSVLLGILFFFPVSSSGLNYIAEKRQGTLDRSMVAGVTTAEFMLAYSGVQLLVLIIQTIFAFIFLVFVFGISVNGPFFWAASMALLVGFAGVSVGFLLSAICSQEIQAVLLAMGMFVPNLLLAGMIWPLEGMPPLLQYIAYILPCTLACESMRSIVSRGVGIDHPRVWPGFVSTILWILAYWILLAIIHRVRSRE